MKHPAKSTLWAVALLALASPAMAGTLILEGSATPAPKAAAALPSASAAASSSSITTEADRWAIKPSDGKLSRGLMRWARTAGVPLVYEAPKDLPALEVEYSGTFWVALDSLLKDTINGSYPLHGCHYNNIVRVLHTSQPCDR